MTRFLARRLAAMVAMLLLVSFLVFSLLALAPGSLLATLMGTAPTTPELIEATTLKYHLDDPFLVQYGRWLADAVRFDLGTSVRSGENVLDALGQALPMSFQLALFALLLVVLVGIPLGTAAGLRRGAAADRVVSTAAAFGMSAPPFAVGLLLVYVFGVLLDWFPVFGSGDGFADGLWHLVLPAVSLAAGLMAIVLRQTRAAMLDVMDQDYITFARARGVAPGRVLVKYALRNAAVPIVTSSGVVLIAALSGAVLVETVFSLPGVGSLLVVSVNTKDIPMVQGIAMVAAAFVILVNLAVDVLTGLLDPRIRARQVAS
ncbi:ABC transporter permease [Actinosynnema sp. NPDC047251]|uniref:ABC-type transporter, permease subunit n=1 Tax=Saccharothrix espanaensis (strain ATCC 51144 / DSM 44229 / JCM 9112 / NBRC 15066 / NRRL 15764) TaxID=1179773 RepID=K0K4F8_SACES|nr:ABC transporter permease [Saccharothrix espanaensis]CCH32487.1 ABC-type transporter, permease subunit [Saccharothrix espanaensis DSM 44229]